ncbi:MAG: ATP synthase F0 subunit B [Alphaproteobacteria bacterium]|nr:ATP synthase F0 subunit B [Alphaproteobacteria bacterium]
MMRARLALAGLVLGAALAAPAIASEPHGDGHAAEPHAAPAHGEATHAGEAHAEGGHGDAAHAEGGHGGGHHLSYAGDDDNDGTANWLDGDSEAYVLGGLAFHAVNLAILLVLLWLGFGGKLRDTLKQRAVRIRSEIEDAQRIKAEAAARHAELAQRLGALEQELAAMLASAKEDGEAEEARLKARADAVGRQIAETAQRQIADEAARAGLRLRRQAVELAVELAEGIVRKQLQAGDQERLAEQFLASIGSTPREGEA